MQVTTAMSFGELIASLNVGSLKAGDQLVQLLSFDISAMAQFAVSAC